MKNVLLIALTIVLRQAHPWVPSSNAPRRVQLPASSTTDQDSNLVLNLEEADDRKIRFGGIGRLYTKEQPSGLSSDSPLTTAASEPDPTLVVLDRLKSATVAVVGLGGVGSWAAEALCRSGVGSLILIDLDDICVSNINRQLHALSSTVGAMKIEEMKRRLLDINADCNITLIHDFISQDNVHELIGGHNLTALLDAIDGSKEKSALLAACADLTIPVVTCGGSAGRKDPTQILCGDINRISGDKLLGTCRKNLRKYHGFEKGLSFREKQKSKKKVRKWNIACVYSTEEQKRLPQGSDASSLRLCDGALGTACVVTGTSGFVAASRIIDMIAEDRLVAPRR